MLRFAEADWVKVKPIKFSYFPTGAEYEFADSIKMLRETDTVVLREFPVTETTDRHYYKV